MLFYGLEQNGYNLFDPERTSVDAKCWQAIVTAARKLVGCGLMACMTSFLSSPVATRNNLPANSPHVTWIFFFQWKSYSASIVLFSEFLGPCFEFLCGAKFVADYGWRAWQLRYALMHFSCTPQISQIRKYVRTLSAFLAGRAEYNAMTWRIWRHDVGCIVSSPQNVNFYSPAYIRCGQYSSTLS